MPALTLQEVREVRECFARAREIAASRFRESFATAPADLPPNERWRSHLEIQAQAMLEELPEITMPPDRRIVYIMLDEARRLIAPVVVVGNDDLSRFHSIGDRAKPETALFPFFRIERTGTALLAWWMFTSELLSSTSWKMTRLLATSDEYNDALAAMEQPQLVRPLFVSILPSAEFKGDEAAFLEVTVYTRAQEERIERRTLLLDPNQELIYHGRDLIAEGRGAVPV
ncbi:MAG TPA: hypothetical protein VHL58_20280 [Thermoanaerobaculia bacterium]|nr:hypothetical protein [Thermoanaerobaculia bacterium]